MSCMVFRILHVTCLIFLLTACKVKNQNKVDLSFLPIAGGSVLWFPGDIDTSVTSSCGTASTATSTSTGNTGTTGTTTTSTSGTTNTKFAIVSQLVFKTRETLFLRYTYDYLQTQGNINAQQGFVLTGGYFAKTATGTQGTVKWASNGININTSLTAAQEISTFTVDLDLIGTYVDGATTTNNTTCYTLDNVNCTAQTTTTTTTCYTSNNQTCLVASTNSGATQVIIRGSLKCYAPNVVQQ